MLFLSSPHGWVTIRSNPLISLFPVFPDGLGMFRTTVEAEGEVWVH